MVIGFNPGGGGGGGGLPYVGGTGKCCPSGCTF